MKKILLAFILTTGILSCFCDNAKPYWNINDFAFEFLNDDNEWAITDTVTLDTLNFIVDFELNFTSENSFQNECLTLPLGTRFMVIASFITDQ